MGEDRGGLLALAMRVVVLVLATAVAAVVFTYWLMARRFVAGDAHALDGIVQAPVNEPLVFRNVSLWDGRGGPVQRARSVIVRDGRIADILDAGTPAPAGMRTIDGTGRTLIPGLIDEIGRAHV